jgi:glycosyltransferase involved in cell wall biosynthesis
MVSSLEISFTGIVVTCNDSAHLDECLSHLAFCNELIVVDLGSTDLCVEIATKFGAKVIHHEWVPMVEMVRQFAVDQSSNDWIVFMDPDMIFPTCWVEHIRDSIRFNSGLASIGISYRNYFLGKAIKHGRWGGVNAYPAIFHRDRFELPSVVHRGLHVKTGWQSLHLQAKNEREFICHYWADSLNQFIKKHKRYVILEGVPLYQNGHRYSWITAAVYTIAAFFRSLIIQWGWLDGWRGVALSGFWSWYTWNAWLSLRKYENSPLDKHQSELDKKSVTRKEFYQMKKLINVGRHLLGRYLNHIAQMIQPRSSGENLLGDRDIEWSWILSRIKNGPGKALDLGCGDSLLLSLTAAQRGYDVLAIDRERHEYPFVTKGVTFKLVDVLEECFSPNYFDLIIVCSTIEHIGLPNRYQSPIPEGDLIVMEKLHDAIEPDGMLLLTLPIGLDAVFAPYHRVLLTLPIGLDAVFAPCHRVYGEVRLPRLLKGWSIIEEIYWIKQPSNQWLSVSRQEALAQPGSNTHYGLGCFVLRK